MMRLDCLDATDVGKGGWMFSQAVGLTLSPVSVICSGRPLVLEKIKDILVVQFDVMG